MGTTIEEYRGVVASCKIIFAHKMHDYGAAWQVLRLPSLTDQLLIKTQRIRTIQDKGIQQVTDSIEEELVGIVNYCVMALIQIRNPSSNIGSAFEQVEPLYDDAIAEAYQLLENKNHDYNEVWRSMRVSSIVDIILMKLLRLKKIEDLGGKTIASEGAQANYIDILNYAVFSLILIKDKS